MDGKKIKKAVNQLDKKYLPKLRKYEQQEEKLHGRTSYSKTDKDATFLMSKTNQILPSYNVIIGTEEQLIINYSLHQKASETDKFIPHIEKLKQRTNGQRPKRITGDGTYGTEENYNYLEQERIESYLKYPGFYQEVTGKAKKKPYSKTNFFYNEQEDKVYCPEGQQMSFVELEKRKTDNGYLQEMRKYRGDCRSCKALSVCSKSPYGRTIQINKNLEAYKKIAKENLTSEIGIEPRKNRSVDVETVFGDIK